MYAVFCWRILRSPYLCFAGGAVSPTVFRKSQGFAQTFCPDLQRFNVRVQGSSGAWMVRGWGLLSPCGTGGSQDHIQTCSGAMGCWPSNQVPLLASMYPNPALSLWTLALVFLNLK